MESNLIKNGFEFFLSIVVKVRFDEIVWRCVLYFEKFQENGLKM